MNITKRTKTTILIILIMMFLVFAIIHIYNNLNYKLNKIDRADVSVENLKRKLKKSETTIITNLELNNNTTYYNKVENVYYYYIDESYFDKYTNLDLEVFSNRKYSYIINNENYDQQNGFYINPGQIINLFLFDEDNYYETTIKFTSVPIVSLITDKEITTFEEDVIFELYGLNNNETQIIKSSAKIRTRGSSSSFYPKKSYRVSLFNGANKNPISLLGMRESNEWILDSIYNDYSKVRSKLAFDLWNEINSYTYNKIDNDIKSNYVDVYLNDEHLGLYLLKETVDWQSLKLNETTYENSGILIKGINFDQINYSEYDNNKKTNMVLPYEMKYPKNMQDYSYYWDTIINKINKNDYDFYNYIDYKIFSHVILALDNLSEKNKYLSIQDSTINSKLIITPWDLDITFGYNFDGNPTTFLGEDYDNYDKEYDLLNESENVKKFIKERYFELRESILSEEHVYSLIDTYYKQIKYSVELDSQKWLETNLEQEIDEIKEWYKNRVTFLDGLLGENNVQV